MPNYYEVLQVSPEAELDAIRSAYHRLAHKYHPDHNPSPEASRKMREINAAYEVLGNQEQRARYDGKHMGVNKHSQVEQHSPTPKRASTLARAMDCHMATLLRRVSWHLILLIAGLLSVIEAGPMLSRLEPISVVNPSQLAPRVVISGSGELTQSSKLYAVLANLTSFAERRVLYVCSGTPATIRELPDSVGRALLKLEVGTRVDVAGTIDSWYYLEENGSHTGLFVHETELCDKGPVARANQPPRFDRRCVGYSGPPVRGVHRRNGLKVYYESHEIEYDDPTLGPKHEFACPAAAAAKRFVSGHPDQ